MSLFTDEAIIDLGAHTKAKLRSTQILTSLPQLVSELVQNSLDAGASHIEVGIDPAEWECWVRDNGTGMSAEGMEMLTKGHDEGRYSVLQNITREVSFAYELASLDTSKTYDAPLETNMFGFRGEGILIIC